MLIKPPVGINDDKVQYAEIVIPHRDFKIKDKIRQIIEEIDDPYRIFFSFSMICLHGNTKFSKNHVLRIFLVLLNPLV